MSQHNTEHQQHIEDFDIYLREHPEESANPVQAVIDFARKRYAPRAEPTRFSALVEGLYPLAEEHSRGYFEREVERVLAEYEA